MKKKRKIWIPVLACVLAAGIAAAAILVWRDRHAKQVDVYPVENLYDTYWGDDFRLDGTVSSGKTQNVMMREGLIQSINVSEGDTVAAGDVLMVYDTTSFQLTLQSDQARITLLESNIEIANRNLAKYRGLRPSEEAPQPTEEIIDHGPLVLKDTVDAPDCSGSDLVFPCSGQTVVTAAFLRQLRASGATAEFQLYEGSTLYGSWIVEGSELPETKTEHVEIDLSQFLKPVETVDPDTGETVVTQPPAGPFYQTITAEAIQEDFSLDSFLTFTGDSFTTDSSVESAGYGQFIPCTPTEYEQYETVYHDNYIPDGSDNYMYSKAELAELVKQTEQEIATLQLDLKAAQLAYQQDQLVSETGEVTAVIGGTVTEVKDPATLALGDTLFTVKGTESYTVTGYIGEMNLDKVSIGDTMSVFAYESGNTVTATISEISTTPVTGSYGWGNENPNNSYYPITATVDDPDVDLRIGEWCEITLMSNETETGGIYLPLMYVRKDSAGSYVMLADENGRLKKQYVSTGKTLWGYEIEIKSGITLEDRIAFPYGKTVKEGAPVNDLDYPQY